MVDFRLTMNRPCQGCNAKVLHAWSKLHDICHSTFQVIKKPHNYNLLLNLLTVLSLYSLSFILKHKSSSSCVLWQGLSRNSEMSIGWPTLLKSVSMADSLRYILLSRINMARSSFFNRVLSEMCSSHVNMQKRSRSKEL